MKSIYIYLSLLFISGINAQAQCPFTYFCQDGALYFSWIDFGAGIPNIREIGIFVGPDSDENIHLYPHPTLPTFTSNENGLTYINKPFEMDNCDDLPNRFTLFTMMEQVSYSCVFLSGGQCADCLIVPPAPEINSLDDWLAACPETLSDYILEVMIEEAGCQQWLGDCSDIARFGQVSIGRDHGTNIPQQGDMTVSLAVTDGIISQRLKVNDDTDWCDYVFEEEYKLLSLEEVEAFILENKHLPNIPSGQVIEEAGHFGLKTVTKLQQEKIEEIFLYLIQMDEEARLLEEQLKMALDENNRLKQ